ncbi:MAG TPA: hypothetical protein VG937_30920 [Polyangiaceae bacterium]|nr:hypothetical protein [Polyangiaceae bacterium]
MTITISCTVCGGDFKIPESLFATRFAGRETKIRCKKCGGLILVDGNRKGSRSSVVPPAPVRSGAAARGVRGGAPARAPVPPLPTGTASRARLSSPPARTATPALPRRVSTPPSPGRTSRPPARPSSVAGRRSPLASAQRRRSSRPPARASASAERVSERESVSSAAPALDLPEATLELPVTRREGAGAVLASAVAEAQSVTTAETLPVVEAETLPVVGGETVPVGAEALPVATAQVPALARVALEPVAAEPVAVAQVATSTSSASLRAVELPRPADSDAEWVGAAPLPAEELLTAAPGADLGVAQPAAVAAKPRGSSRGFWIAGAAASAALVAVLSLSSRGPTAPSSAAVRAAGEQRAVPARVEVAKLPRTEAAVSSSASAERGSGEAETESASAANIPQPEPAPSVASAPSPAVELPAAAPSAAAPSVAVPSAAAPLGYNEKALEGALHWGVTQAEACHRGGRPTGTARATMTFSPSGKITQFVLEGEPIASAAVGKCITSYLRAVMIPPFSGPEFTITREITLR